MIIINGFLPPFDVFVTFQYFTVLISTHQNGIEVEEVNLEIKILKLFGVYLQDKVLEKILNRCISTKCSGNAGFYPCILGKGPWAKLGKTCRQNTKIGNTISSEKCQEQNLILCCFLDCLMPVWSDLHLILAKSRMCHLVS